MNSDNRTVPPSLFRIPDRSLLRSALLLAALLSAAPVSGIELLLPDETPAYPDHADAARGAPTPLALEHDGIALGVVQGQASLTRLFVALDDVCKTLHMACYPALPGVETRGAYPHTTAPHTFTFFHNDRSWLIDGQRIAAPESTVLTDAEDILVDIGFLSKHFPFSLSVAYDANRLDIHFDNHPPPLSALLTPPPAPLPDSTLPSGLSAHVRGMVDPRALALRLTDTEQRLPPVPPPPGTPAGKPPDTTAAPPAASRAFTQVFTPRDEHYLVFELRIGRMAHEELVDIYDHQGAYYIALGQLAAALELSVETDPEAGTAEGWITRESNRFSLDAAARTVRINGRETTLAPGDLFVDDTDIFVRHALVAEWFPVDIGIEYGHQYLALTPRTLLPFQEREQRAAQRKRWLAHQKDRPDYPPHVVPYGAGGWPGIDVVLSQQGQFRDTAEDVDGQFTFSTLGVLDSHWWDTRLFLTGDVDGVSTLRLTGIRKDAGQNLLGLGLFSELEFGDIEGFTQPFIASSLQGRGVYLSNVPLEAPTDFDTTTLTGDALPGWEVELYNNAEFLAFQRIEEDGRYEFRDIALRYGANILKLVFYGPQGEIREETRRFLLDSSILRPGALTYRFIGYQKDTGLTEIQMADGGDEWTASGIARYGLNRHLTARYGYTFDQLADGDHGYHTTGLAAAFGGILARADAAYDTKNGGLAGKAVALSRIGGLQLRAEHSRYDDFITAATLGASSTEETVTRMEIAGSLTPVIGQQFSYSLSGERTEFTSGERTETLTNRLTTSVHGVSLTNELKANRGDTDEDINGLLTTRGRIGRTAVRFDTRYAVDPESQLDNLKLSLQRSLNHQISLRTDIEHQVQGDQSTRASGALNWQHDRFRLSVTAEADDDQNVQTGLTLSFSLFHDPAGRRWRMQRQNVTGTGAIAARAYLDRNYDGLRQADEEWLEAVSIRKEKRGYVPESGANGVVIIPGLPAYEPVNISLDETSLEDPLWFPSQPGYAVTTRPGIVSELHFPVVETSEIEGSVFLATPRGETTLSGLTLHLIDAHGQKQAETTSEFDGFYLFTRVRPGRYTVRIADAMLQKLGIEADAWPSVTVAPSGEIYADTHITLREKPLADDLPPLPEGPTLE